MLSVYRKLPLQFRTVKSGRWPSDIRANWFGDADELTGKTVGIVGLGHIGQEVARRLRGFNCRILYNDDATRPRRLEDEPRRDPRHPGRAAAVL